MKRFGPCQPGYPVELPEASTPVGEPCGWCEEPIVDGDKGILVPSLGGKEVLFHHNCFLRSIIGSVSHIQKTCSCFNDDSEESDPPGLTKRQAADAAANEYFMLHSTPSEESCG